MRGVCRQTGRASSKSGAGSTASSRNRLPAPPHRRRTGPDVPSPRLVLTTVRTQLERFPHVVVPGRFRVRPEPAHPGTARPVPTGRGGDCRHPRRRSPHVRAGPRCNLGSAAGVGHRTAVTRGPCPRHHRAVPDRGEAAAGGQRPGRAGGDRADVCGGLPARTLRPAVPPGDALAAHPARVSAARTGRSRRGRGRGGVRVRGAHRGGAVVRADVAVRRCPRPPDPGTRRTGPKPCPAAVGTADQRSGRRPRTGQAR